MDKEVLRMVIIGLGLVVVIALVVVSHFKNKSSRNQNLFNHGDSGLGSIDDSLVIKTEHDEFDIVPIDSPAEVNGDQAAGFDENEGLQPPAFIQFSVVAHSEQGFNGFSLQQEFETLGLVFTELQIYQSLSANSDVRFSIACLVEPGVFPINEMDTFYCPGVVFFMQPDEMENPVHCFDELVASINHIAQTLHGEVRDAAHNPLSIESLQAIRQTLTLS
jgi:cell division protein ZipA